MYTLFKTLLCVVSSYENRFDNHVPSHIKNLLPEIYSNRRYYLRFAVLLHQFFFCKLFFVRYGFDDNQHTE